MRSDFDERLGRLTAAIDGLAAGCPEAEPLDEWIRRLTGVWALVEDLDPEMARSRSRYDPGG